MAADSVVGQNYAIFTTTLFVKTIRKGLFGNLYIRQHDCLVQKLYLYEMSVIFKAKTDDRVVQILF